MKSPIALTIAFTLLFGTMATTSGEAVVSSSSRLPSFLDEDTAEHVARGTIRKLQDPPAPTPTRRPTPAPAPTRRPTIPPTPRPTPPPTPRPTPSPTSAPTPSQACPKACPNKHESFKFVLGTGSSPQSITWNLNYGYEYLSGGGEWDAIMSSPTYDASDANQSYEYCACLPPSTGNDYYWFSIEDALSNGLGPGGFCEWYLGGSKKASYTYNPDRGDDRQFSKTIFSPEY